MLSYSYKGELRKVQEGIRHQREISEHKGIKDTLMPFMYDKMLNRYVCMYTYS